MTAGRAARTAVEALRAGDPNARAARTAVETLRTTSPNARAARVAIETLVAISVVTDVPRWGIPWK